MAIMGMLVGLGGFAIGLFIIMALSEKLSDVVTWAILIGIPLLMEVFFLPHFAKWFF